MLPLAWGFLEIKKDYRKVFRTLAKLIFGEDVLVNGCLQKEKTTIALSDRAEREELNKEELHKLISEFSSRETLHI